MTGIPAPTMAFTERASGLRLELHRVRARFLDEADRVPHRLLVRDLEGAERHVRDDERPPRSARHGAREHQHLVDGGGHRRLVAETVIAAESPTRRCRSAPASSASRPPGAS